MSKIFLHQVEKQYIRGALCLPLLIWIILYFTAPLQPASVKPAPDVHTLYDFDMIMFGFLPSTFLPQHLQCLFLDIIAAIVYTIHSGLPVVFLCYLMLRRRDLVLAYVNCFGIVSLSGVITQMIMPTAPPWYYYDLKFTAASYEIKGNPAGLVRVDAYFGVHFFQAMFNNNPVVFGSFPSLHVAWPTLMCLFAVCETSLHRLVKYGFIFYVCLVTFSVMYLQHHYAVDCLGGLFYSWSIYKLVGPKVKQIFAANGVRVVVQGHEDTSGVVTEPHGFCNACDVV